MVPLEGRRRCGAVKSVGTLYLPSMSSACIIPFDQSIFVGQAVAGGGQLSSGGIQLVTDVEIVPSCPQWTTRWLSLGKVELLMGIMLGLSSGRREVVVHGACGGLLGGFSLGRASQKPRPGKSGRGGGGVLPENLGDVGLEFFLLLWVNGARPHVTCFVVAVNEAFTTDVPTGAHESGVVSFGTILGEFSSKVLLPIFAILFKNSEMGAKFLVMRSPSTLPDFLFFPSFHLPSSPAGVTLLEVGEILGVGLTKFGGRVVFMVLFITISKTLSKEMRRLFTINRSSNLTHSPSQR